MRVAVVGGGPAGFFAALRCRELASRADILLLEKGPDVLRKVAISGGGRCNLAHACNEPELLVAGYPRGARELRGPLTRFGTGETMAWFQSHGVELKTEDDGRIFPASDDSATVVDALLREAARARVRIRRRARVGSLTARPGGGFEITLSGGASLDCGRVLLAPGGHRHLAGYELAARLGHRIVPPVPSLFTFRVDDRRLRGLAGVTVADVSISVADSDLRQDGPLLVTHDGLSGPAILGLSAWGARQLHDRGYRFDIHVAWRRGLTRESAAALLVDQIAHHGRRQVQGGAPLPLPRRLWQALASGAGVDDGRRYGALTHEQRRRLAQDLAACVLAVTGVSPHKEEFVTCGGVALDEVDFRTMESRIVPGLHLAGEFLDIDGITGGYNLQAAWTTGWIAGEGLARPAASVASSKRVNR
jgi:predicted Rossmann fold flavoprotein